MLQKAIKETTLLLMLESQYKIQLSNEIYISAVIVLLRHYRIRCKNIPVKVVIVYYHQNIQWELQQRAVNSELATILSFPRCFFC